MFSTLVLCFAVAGRLANDPPPADPRAQLLPWRSIEAYYHDELERTRRGRQLVEATILMYEDDLRSIPAIYTPKEAIRIRKWVEKWRGELDFMKQWEQELERWELQQKANPGPETNCETFDRLRKIRKEWNAWQEAQERGVNLAPMPREKKRPTRTVD
jgi:hypothetical protein